ncbi:N-acetylglucosamine-6-phosphate deacetylase [Ramlibacter albus]|uniref:N-acetylglucosamine-6-phosphate deacetylase n=1 Tax=Ramlibacter albus TaxID=2079448 RepID=A0A923M9Q3_9BURK|nr:N-acetylglucosamine-6-phosphate deacetylase [Ramlibacter albus]
MRTLQGHVLTPGGWVRGRIDIGEDGHIARIEGDPVEDAAVDGDAAGDVRLSSAERIVRDSSEPLILPGFIDLHVHGGDGRDIMEGSDAAAAVARCHARHGTTALLATTMTAPMDDLVRAFEALSPLCRLQADASAPAGTTRGNGGVRGSGARILGVHLEGPYINPGRLGAQPDYARRVSMDELQRLHALAPIRLVTLAPEMPHHLEDIPALVQAGFRVQVGHSAGSYDDGVQALARGAAGFTHLFNAMTGMHHREPGIVGAALAHAQYAEIIPDMMHVHPGAIRAAMRAIPCLYCVTDSTAATGMPDGDYMLGRQQVTKCLGGVRLADGTLAGSALTMDQALRNLVEKLGLSLADASKRVSTFAADYLGLPDRGRLAQGAWCDAVVLDRDLQLKDVYLEGEPLALADAR